MSNIRPTTELDFDAIKSDLITFIKSNDTFTDYNFEGSALNAIVDILAYNTHLNAYYANMLHNEGFLDTAQKRSSVVSRAKELGYTPRSVTGAAAYVNVAVGFSIENTNLNSIVLKKGTQFTSINDNGSFTFVADKNYISTKNNSSHYFSQVKLVEGVKLTNTFTVDTTRNVRSVFTIPNKSIDTSTLQIFVKDSSNSVDLIEYSRVNDFYNLTPDSRVYFLQESYNGFYQVYFGGDVIGSQPVNGNIIVADYIYTDSFESANLCTSFTFTGSIEGSSGVSVVTTQQAYGGSVKEDINSIKSNAIKSNSAKERSVTVTDYELLLVEQFSFIKSVSVWGGEENMPPVYGKVYISVQPITGYTLTDLVKRDVITPIIRSKSMITISPVFIDPEYIYVDFKTILKFNPFKTQTSKEMAEMLVKQAITNHITDISRFNTDYLESTLVKKLLDIDYGIISVDIDKRVGFNLVAPENVSKNYKKTVNSPIIANSITSSIFNIFYGDSVVAVSMRQIPDTNTLSLYSGTTPIINIGTIDIISGTIDITFSVYTYITASRYINIRFELVDDDIQVRRNKIIVLDDKPQDTLINIGSNNIVSLQIYDK